MRARLRSRQQRALAGAQHSAEGSEAVSEGGKRWVRSGKRAPKIVFYFLGASASVACPKATGEQSAFF